METPETQGDYWELMRIRETKDDETQGKYLGLMRFLIPIKTKGDSLVSEKLMRLVRLIGTLETQGGHWRLNSLRETSGE